MCVTYTCQCPSLPIHKRRKVATLTQSDAAHYCASHFLYSERCLRKSTAFHLRIMRWTIPNKLMVFSSESQHKILLISDSHIWRYIASHLRMLLPNFLVGSSLRFCLLCFMLDFFFQVLPLLLIHPSHSPRLRNSLDQTPHYRILHPKVSWWLRPWAAFDRSPNKELGTFGRQHTNCLPHTNSQECVHVCLLFKEQYLTLFLIARSLIFIFVTMILILSHITSQWVYNYASYQFNVSLFVCFNDTVILFPVSCLFL
jgi:hypothetical protein